MFSINIKNSFFIVALFFLFPVFLFQSAMAIAGDWGCEGLKGNMNTLKINSDPQGILRGSDCDTDALSGGGDKHGKKVYVMQATDGAMSMAFYLDISDSIIDEGATVKFMQLESGSGYDQALLLNVQLSRNVEGMQLLVDWYQPANTPYDVTLVQSDVLNISDYAVGGVVTINFDWNAGIAALSILESGIASVLLDSHLFSPRIYHVGVIEQSGINMQGKLYRLYDTEINLID